MTDESLEGWCTDPYGVHEARWLSNGAATPLVRDGDVEGHDPPPDEPFKVTPVLIWDARNPARSLEEIRREDEEEKAGASYNEEEATRRAFDVIDQSDA